MLSSKVVVGVAVLPNHLLLSSVHKHHVSRRFLTPKASYERKIQAKELLPDKDQKACAQQLDDLYRVLQNYKPTPVSTKSAQGGGFLGKLLRKDEGPPKIQLLNTAAPKGLYIYGSVGGGKTTLMDMFYDCCVDVSKNQ